MSDSSLDPQNLQQEIENVERDLLDQIIQNLKNKQISVEEAQKLAKDFLSFLPMKDKEDLLLKLKELGKKHPESLGVYLKYANHEEEMDKEKRLHTIAGLIKHGEIEKAIQVAKGEKI